MTTMTVSLTPNVQTTAVMTAKSARVMFQSLRAKLWVTFVTRSSAVASIPWTCGNSLARFQSGLTITLRKSAFGGYVLIANGSVDDSGTTHRLKNHVIGSFTP